MRAMRFAASASGRDAVAQHGRRDARAEAAVRLSVVVVNWNGADYLGDCLQSVAGPDREVIVVDNASSDASAELVARDHPAVRWLANDANLGFSRAANRGLHAARGDFVLFLNPDARSRESAIAAAIDVLERRADVGLVSVAVRDPAGGITPTVEPFFSFRTLSRARWAGRVRAPAGPGPVEVDWCHGVFLVARRADLLAIGGFDERFFLYAEDMDLCFRVHEAGRSVVYLPEVSIVHEGNRAGSVLLAERRAAAIFASSLLFYARHHGRLAQLGLRAVAGLVFGVRSLGYRLARSPLAERYHALARVAFVGPSAGFPESATGRGGKASP
jgi:GT2 family glycosyltransferase